jgi:hypothetical protein
MKLTMKQKSHDEKCHVHIVMDLWVLIQTLSMDEFWCWINYSTHVLIL